MAAICWRTRVGSCVWYSSRADEPVSFSMYLAAEIFTRDSSGVLGMTNAATISGITLTPGHSSKAKRRRGKDVLGVGSCVLGVRGWVLETPGCPLTILNSTLNVVSTLSVSSRNLSRSGTTSRFVRRTVSPAGIRSTTCSCAATSSPLIRTVTVVQSSTVGLVTSIYSTQRRPFVVIA